jgi:hypothetical protein
MPDTAPARIMVLARRLHPELAHVARKTKNMASAAMLATTAMTAEPTTLTTAYSHP